MPESLDEPATKTIRRLLYQNWEPTNTHGYDPSLNPSTDSDALPLHYGNYNSDLPDPQISIAQPQGERTVGGRWSGKNMQTGEMNQFRRGTPLIQCWAEYDGAYNDGEDAQDLVRSLRVEVERILGNFDQGPVAGGNSDIIWSFSVRWDGRFPDDEVPPTWQSQLSVTYDWERSQ